LQKAEGLILLVEDNMTKSDSAKAYLRTWGYRVHTVANGEEGSRLFRGLIMIDLMVWTNAVMDGYEADQASAC